jgi:hypothetical protein
MGVCEAVFINMLIAILFIITATGKTNSQQKEIGSFKNLYTCVYNKGIKNCVIKELII